MPENTSQWLWYLFFFFGALGGWWALIETVRLYLLDQSNKPQEPDPHEYDTVVEFEPRTRNNLPVYRPRRRGEHRS
jgi:hypothetical protein